MSKADTMSNLYDIVAPDGQQEGTRSLITRWLKKPGEAVREHEPLVELETDKVSVEIAAPASGLLAEIKMPEDTEVSPGDLLGRIDTKASATAESDAADAPVQAVSARAEKKNEVGTSDQPLKLSPLVKRLLRQHDLDPVDIPGTGRRGRITRDDVMGYLEQMEAPATKPQPVAPSAMKTVSGPVPSHSIPHDNMRKRIAAHMLESVTHAPHVTSVFEADLTRVMAHRAANKADFASRGVNLTYTAYFVAACVKAIRDVPTVNSRFHDDALEIWEDFNIGVGTALEDKGLIVPVIHKAQDLSLFGIASRLQELTQKARDGKLTGADVQNGTFTISNHGVSGSLVATPIIINQPQSAILGIGKLEKRVTVIDVEGQDTIQIRPKCYVTLTIDHRVLDGHQTNKFLSSLVDVVNNWSL